MHQNFPLFKSIFGFMILSFLFRAANAQCSSSLAHNGTTAASVSFTGSRYGYDIPNNVKTADNVYATATAILAVLSGPTQNLTLTNFGFSVPSSATICGVVADVKKKAANVNVLSTVADYSVKLVKAGAVSGNSKALSGNWTTTNTSFTYGGENDTWGLTLTPADVNASNFGIAFSAYINGTISLIPSAQIDHIQLTVYYTFPVLPVIISGFKATSQQNKVTLQWNAQQEINFSHYEIERSDNGRDFKKIASEAAAVYSRDYSFTDAFPNKINFYRLKMIDKDSNYKYSAIVSAKAELSGGDVFINSNPMKDLSVVHLRDCQPGRYKVEVVNYSGQVICSWASFVRNDLDIPLSLVSYAKGLYIINVYHQAMGLVRSLKLLRE